MFPAQEAGLYWDGDDWLEHKMGRRLYTAGLYREAASGIMCTVHTVHITDDRAEETGW